jgi:4-hydroxy-tetrahydrodipicolinate reductase
MKKIAVVGYKGKMGEPIFLALMKNFNVVGIGRWDSLENCCDLNLVIDLASGESSVKSAEYCLKRNIPIIIGATGQTEQEESRLKEISKSIKVVKKSNFSIGFEMLLNVIDSCLKCDPVLIEIFEKHHINKKDSPSGTAIELKKYMESKCEKQINIHSIREGDEKGEHLIRFMFKQEILEIKHNVLSRQAFVEGCVKEVENLLY